MAFNRPTLVELKKRIQADLKTALNIKAVLPRSFINVLSIALAGIAHTLHGHMLYISRQLFPDKADDEFAERWGAIYGVTRKPASFARLLIKLTGVNGLIIPIATTLKRDDGALYETLDSATIASGEAQVLVVSKNAGSVYNIPDTQEITLESPIANVDSTATVVSTNLTGVDIETIDSYRARIVSRIQEPPSGGTVADYKRYALAVAGVTRVWVTPNGVGEGTVVVYIVADNEVNILPTQGLIDATQLEVDTKKPVTSTVFVVSPVSKTLDINVKITPFNDDVKNAIKAEIKDLLAREAQVRNSYKNVSSSFSGKIKLSQINEAISIATGEQDHILISPSQDVIPSVGGIVIDGVYTFGVI